MPTHKKNTVKYGPGQDLKPGDQLAFFWQDHLEILKSFLWNQSRLAVILLDEEKTVIDGNHGFARLMGDSFDWLGQPLQELLLPEGVAALNSFPNPGESRTTRLNFLSQPSGTNSLTCQVYHTGQGFVVFGEKPLVTHSEVVNQLTSLNNELANLSRELGQKNRELEQANVTITRLMRTDSLTGLANRRYFLETLATAISLAKRHGTPLSLVMADLDHFKRINDTWGHGAGDVVLQGFARLLTGDARMEDLAARFGGEEFIVLLPHTDAAGAAHFAERVRKDLASQEFPEIDQKVKASFGVCQLTPEEEADSLIKRTDQALYQAKAAGRNRVVKA